MLKIKHIDLFSGIGGFALAADRVFGEVEHIFVENDAFCAEVLQKHWSSSKIYGDIKNFTWEKYAQDVNKKENSNTVTTGVLDVVAKMRNDIIKITEKSDSNTPRNADGHNEMKSSTTTEESVSVVESQNRGFLPSTTNMEAGRKNETKKVQDTQHISTSSEKVSQIDTNYSVTTVTVQKDTTDIAHITKNNYGDIRTLTNTNDAGLQEEGAEQQTAGGTRNTPFLLTGGFPCQPFSHAGRRKGTEDDRYLWPEMLRVIREFQPTWVIAENVRGLLTQGGGVVFEQVCTDLESAGYEVQPIVIPAVAVNAPHRRDRVWFVAHRNADSNGRVGWAQEKHAAESGESALNDSQGRYTNATNPTSVDEERRDDRQGEAQFRRSDWSKNWHEVATALCRVDDGVPRRLDRNPRLKALGNAIVPQVAEEIMQAIKHATRQN